MRTFLEPDRIGQMPPHTPCRSDMDNGFMCRTKFIVANHRLPYDIRTFANPCHSRSVQVGLLREKLVYSIDAMSNACKPAPFAEFYKCNRGYAKLSGMACSYDAIVANCLIIYLFVCCHGQKYTKDGILLTRRKFAASKIYRYWHTFDMCLWKYPSYPVQPTRQAVRGVIGRVCHDRIKSHNPGSTVTGNVAILAAAIR